MINNQLQQLSDDMLEKLTEETVKKIEAIDAVRSKLDCNYGTDDEQLAHNYLTKAWLQMMQQSKILTNEFCRRHNIGQAQHNEPFFADEQ